MANEILNFFYRGQAISIGANLYIRLLVAPSARAGGGTEQNCPGYARLITPRGTGVFVAPSNGAMANSVVLNFGTPTGSGNGALVYFDFVDTASGAFTKRYNGGPISPAKLIVVGKAIKFRVGGLQLSF